MKISFVLDLIPRYPIGGVKIIFKYANHFAEKGHDVKILFCSNFLMSKEKYLPYGIRKAIVQTYLWKGVSWFKIDSKVKRICIDSISDNDVPDGDVIFATAAPTAERVARLSSLKGKKYYLIQDYEAWAGEEGYVEKTYQLGMNNITIADWLCKKVSNISGKKAILIRNPIDTEVFKITVAPDARFNHSIAMVCQTDERKGFKYGLEAIIRIKELFPDTKCTIFGVSKRDAVIPEWIEYKQNVTEAEAVRIYNGAAIFLCSSISEGYGLCGAESMACGCALVSTDYEGVHSYATENEDVLLSETKNIDAMMDNIKLLFENNDLRIKIAQKGNENIQKISWKKAFELMDDLIC